MQSDPFQVLGLEPRFDLDVEMLETRHRELSRVLHPDRHVGQPAGERRRALSSAIAVNDAFRALKDPLKRAQLLLERHGVRFVEGSEPPSSPAFLIDVLELREALADAQRARKLDVVRKLASEFEQRSRAALESLGGQFAKLETGADTPLPAEMIQSISAKLGELRYLRRLLSEARSIEDELA